MRKETTIEVMGSWAALAGLLLLAGCSESPTGALEDVELSASTSGGATVIGTDLVEQELDEVVSAERNACLDEATRVQGTERVRTQLVMGPTGKLHVNLHVDRNGVDITGLESERRWVLQPDILNTKAHLDPERPGFPLCDGCHVFHISQRAIARALDEGPDYHIRTTGQLVVRPDGTVATFFQRQEFLECFPNPPGSSS